MEIPLSNIDCYQRNFCNCYDKNLNKTSIEPRYLPGLYLLNLLAFRFELSNTGHYYLTTVASSSTVSVENRPLTSSRVVACLMPYLCKNS